MSFAIPRPKELGLNEKAKSLGMPLVPVDTVIMCESEMAIGFNWENGTYSQGTFSKRKHILKKVEPFEGCYEFEYNPYANHLSLKYTFGSRQVCIKHHIFGEEPRKKGGQCYERYDKREDGTWDIRISCEDTTDTPEIRLSPNGFYHLARIHDNVSSKPKRDYKDSQYIEWGKCATISP